MLRARRPHGRGARSSARAPRDGHGGDEEPRISHGEHGAAARAPPNAVRMSGRSRTAQRAERGAASNAPASSAGVDRRRGASAGGDSPTKHRGPRRPRIGHDPSRQRRAEREASAATAASSSCDRVGAAERVRGRDQHREADRLRLDAGGRRPRRRRSRAVVAATPSTCAPCTRPPVRRRVPSAHDAAPIRTCGSSPRVVGRRPRVDPRASRRRRRTAPPTGRAPQRLTPPGRGR